MKIDYLIVGFGLAGMAIAEVLRQHRKTFVIYEDGSQNSSLVAGGMYNPVILKRFTPVWNAKAQLDLALPFYTGLEKELGNTYLNHIHIHRIFKNIEEQNNWYLASDKKLLEDYMCTAIEDNNNASIDAPFGYGKLKGTGRLDVNLLLSDYKEMLLNENLMKQERFVHGELLIEENKIEYKGDEANRVIFCEGYGLKGNPFFNYLPLKEVKGELITIHAPDLKINYLIKAAVFVMPIGNDLYKVGATFNWEDKTNESTAEGREELVKKLESFLQCEYEIVDQSAGIRPTVIDRRPMIGVHPEHKHLAILNGLGTRGVMLAPLMAKNLYGLLENDDHLENEISIDRFKHLY